MLYWFDTEFIEDGKTIDLLSIGIVAEDGRELYLENSEADLSKANDWVRENVFPYLHECSSEPIATICPRNTRAKIAETIQGFCAPTHYGKPEFWAYYADYDWVVLCQLFGRMSDLPDGWPMFCMDIKQVAHMVGDPKLLAPPVQEHYALADARWNRQVWEFLREYGNGIGLVTYAK